jgi:hypothetical protein
MSKTQLAILQQAISDVGRWSWWTGEPQRALQLEFSGVQLWFPPAAAGQAPSGQVALRFRNPRLVTFLSRSDDDALTSDSWPARFQADELGGFTVSPDQFTLTDPASAAAWIAEATHVIPLVGALPTEAELQQARAWVAFWAGPVGIVVAAEEMEIFSHHGPVRLDEIEALCGKWWEYWREYWDKKDTDAALPHDHACEVTIPAGEE